jgi:hypothetical protein
VLIVTCSVLFQVLFQAWGPVCFQILPLALALVRMLQLGVYTITITAFVTKDKREKIANG